MSDIDPSFGRDAELHRYATSDLSVEEQLAGGASVDDLVAAGILYDDYDPDNDSAYDFTSLQPEEEEISEGSPMPEEEFEALKNRLFRHGRMADEYRKKSSRRGLMGQTEDAPDRPI